MLVLKTERNIEILLKMKYNYRSGIILQKCMCVLKTERCQNKFEYVSGENNGRCKNTS